MASIEEVPWKRTVVKRVGLSANCQFGDILELMKNEWSGQEFVSGQPITYHPPRT